MAKEPGIQKIEGVHGTHYRAQIRIKGFKHVSKNFRTLAEAKNWRLKTMHAMKTGEPYETTVMRRCTIGDLIDRYIQNELCRETKNYKTYLGQLLWWKKEIGHSLLSHLKEDLICQCRDKLSKTFDHQGRKKTPATVNRYLSALSSVLSIAVREWRLIPHSPMRNVRKLQESKGRERILSRDERVRLLKSCKESSCKSLYLIVLLALATSMRRGEILNLRRKDVDLVEGKITLEKTKNGDRRVVPITGPVLAALIEFLQKEEGLQPGDLLFSGRGRRDRPTDFRTAWNHCLRRAEISDFTFHDLRHCAISYLGALGYPLHIISKIAGHRTFSMTADRYSHLVPEQAQEAIEKLGQELMKEIEL